MHSIYPSMVFFAVKLLPRESNHMNDWVCFYFPSLFVPPPSDGHARMWSHFFPETPQIVYGRTREKSHVWLYLETSMKREKKHFWYLFRHRQLVYLWRHLSSRFHNFTIKMLQKYWKSFFYWKIFFLYFCCLKFRFSSVTLDPKTSRLPWKL